MPIKQVFTSDPGVYRTGLAYGLDPWAGTSDASRIYDEFIWWVIGIAVVENPASPTDYEIAVFFVNRERSSGVGAGANTVAMRWSGLTGQFLGHDGRNRSLGFRNMVTGANGTVRASWSWIAGPNNSVYKLDPTAYLFNEVRPAGFYEGSDGGLLTTPCVDEEEDLALMISSSPFHNTREIAVHRESTGQFLYKFRVSGIPKAIFMTDDRRAYVVADDGILTLFDYTTGQVLGILHVGGTANERVWTWDRVSKRLLSFEFTQDAMPYGTCTCRIRGYYPIPQPVGLTAPIPLQAPAQGHRVEWLTKVYGAVGEGVPGVAVNYSLDSATGVNHGPIKQATDLNGNSRTFVTSSLAGGNTLTATAEV